MTCGTKVCAAPTNACCYGASAICWNPADTAGCNFGMKITCGGPGDCPTGQMCCGQHMNYGFDFYSEVKCQTSCDANADQRTFCNGKPSVCPTGTQCAPSTIITPGYNVCQ
jgi:hypothetical protein